MVQTIPIGARSNQKQSEIFYLIILLINIMMSYMDVLKNVIAAIVTNMKMLGMLSLLGTSFIAIFSIFSINYYASSLYE